MCDGERMYFWQLCMGSSFHRYISWSQANCKVNWVTKKAMHLQIVFVDIELFYTGGFFSLQTLSP